VVTPGTDETPGTTFYAMCDPGDTLSYGHTVANGASLTSGLAPVGQGWEATVADVITFDAGVHTFYVIAVCHDTASPAHA
jgi:hypothetical protein